jgi:hypothetical protein
VYVLWISALEFLSGVRIGGEIEKREEAVRELRNSNENDSLFRR